MISDQNGQFYNTVQKNKCNSVRGELRIVTIRCKIKNSFV